MKISIFILSILLFTGCAERFAASAPPPTPNNKQILKSIDTIPASKLIIKSKKSFGGFKTASYGIRYDTITYTIPCKFFKYNIKFKVAESGYKGLKVYTSIVELDKLLNDYKAFKVKFNKDILDRSETIIKKGKVDSKKFIIEERSTTIKAKCKPFTFKINRDIFVKTKDENALTFSSKIVDEVISDYISFKLKYNYEMGCNPFSEN